MIVCVPCDNAWKTCLMTLGSSIWVRKYPLKSYLNLSSSLFTHKNKKSPKEAVDLKQESTYSLAKVNKCFHTKRKKANINSQTRKGMVIMSQK